MKKKFGRLFALAIAVATAGTFMLASSAAAATPASTTCSEGTLAAGSYRNVTVTGSCTIDGSAAVGGNVSISSGAVLFLQGAELGGNLTLGTGSIMMAFSTTVHGNVSATNARALYLFDSRVDRNVSFIGGGSGRDCVDPDPETSLGMSTMVKDSSIGGNAVFDGWSGCWFGFLRNTVGRNVQISNMYANPENIIFPGTPDEVNQGLDSTEVIGNTVGGVLNCTGNTPAAQIGDAAPLPNTARKALGECAALT